MPTKTHVATQIRKMLKSGDLKEFPDVSGVFRVDAPFASEFPAPDEAIIQEANPTSVFSHFTAFAYHGLTTEIPEVIQVSTTGGQVSRYPLGTTPDDWIDIPPPKHRKPSEINDRPVVWTQLKPEWDFGEMIGFVEGSPIYVTDLERTLIDSVRFPNKCGGIIAVINAWSHARDDIDVNKVVQYAERIGQPILKQRIGFVCEKLALSHPQFDRWARNSSRGSSAVFLAGAPFSPYFDERWNLSINVPDSVIAQFRG